MLNPPKYHTHPHHPISFTQPVDVNENLPGPLDLNPAQETNPKTDIHSKADVFQNLNPNCLGDKVQATLNNIDRPLSENVIKDSVNKSLEDLQVEIPTDPANLESSKPDGNEANDTASRVSANATEEEDTAKENAPETANEDVSEGAPTDATVGHGTSLARGVGPRELPTIKGKQYIVKMKEEVLPARRLPKYLPDADGGMWKVWPYPEVVELSTDSEEELVPLPDGLRWDGYNLVNADGSSVHPDQVAPTWFVRLTNWMFWLIQSINLYKIFRYVMTYFSDWILRKEKEGLQDKEKLEGMTETDTSSTEG